MLLARRSYFRLVLLWLCFALPVILLSSVLLLFELSLYWVLFINWWFKPLYELPVLLYLSKAIFSQPTTLKAVMRESISFIPALLRSFLTLSRLSPSRSLTAPVVFLERLKGKARSSRVSVLTSETTRAYTLMMAWLNMEGIAYYALLAALVAFLPNDYDTDEMLGLFVGEAPALNVTFKALFIFLPSLIAALVAPMYVAAGFLLYINRRMRLEAWDIEHEFHALESRHQSKASVGPSTASTSALAIFAVSLLLATLSFTPVATANAQESSIPRVADVREQTHLVFESDDFGSSKTVEKLRFIKKDKKDAEPDLSSPILLKIAEAIIGASRLIVYVAAGIILVLVIWALLKFTPSHWRFKRRPKLDALTVEHHPLTRSLPDDIAAHALAALNSNNPREAISLLYRGALGTVMRRHDLSIPTSATEFECQQLVEQCNNPKQTHNFNRITNQWSQTAYASYNPTHPEILELIELWKAEFKNVFANDKPKATT